MTSYREACQVIATEVIRQAVDDLETCVKQMWKGKRHHRISDGTVSQGRKEIIAWIKGFTPQYRAIFKYSMARAREDMCREYETAYENMRRAEEQYAKVCRYPFWNTTGCMEQAKSIANAVDKRIQEEKKKHGKPI